MKSFEVASKSLPTELLVSALKKEKALLYEIHPSKLEQLAQHVFADHYECEVKHVGRSNDGGIDLIIVQSDDPILVQVKRRSSPHHVEGVDVVRDLIGAMYINGAASGIVLSTAKSFSRVASATANRMVSDRRLRQFQLIDYPSFCAMLDVSADERQRAWAKLLGDEVEERASWK